MPTRSVERINEKVQIGLKLLQEAILEYLAKRPDGVSSAQIYKDLGFDEVDGRGKRSDKALWGIHNRLIKEKKIRIDRNFTPHRWFLTNPP